MKNMENGYCANLSSFVLADSYILSVMANLKVQFTEVHVNTGWKGKCSISRQTDLGCNQGSAIS